MFINKINDLYRADNVKLELKCTHYVRSFEILTHSFREMHSAFNVVLSLTYSQSFDDVSIFSSAWEFKCFQLGAKIPLTGELKMCGWYFSGFVSFKNALVELKVFDGVSRNDYYCHYCTELQINYQDTLEPLGWRRETSRNS